MAPPIIPAPHITISATPLEQSTFAPFGTAISSGLPSSLNALPSQLPSLPHGTPKPIVANQSTALKYSPISPFTDTYGQCPSGQRSSARTSLFACFPRQLRRRVRESTDLTDDTSLNATEVFDVGILERHPYTTQTFIPMGVPTESSGGDDDTAYLVIVAPSFTGATAKATIDKPNGSGKEEVTIKNPPDLKNLRAFVARGGQAVTYGAGTWHAPMVVLGKKRVDFVVVQFVNGVADEDCQEVRLGDGIVVDVGLPPEKPRSWSAKL